MFVYFKFDQSFIMFVVRRRIYIGMIEVRLSSLILKSYFLTVCL